MIDEIRDFLNESNAIEGVYDEDSLSQAQYAWHYLMTQDRMSQTVVKKTHKILMLHQKLQPDQKGYYRTVPVWVGGREGLRYQYISFAIAEWCGEMNKKSVDPIGLHVDYENIHPFVDGNGRTGRMFLNWYQIKIMKQPIIIFREKEKQIATSNSPACRRQSNTNTELGKVVIATKN